MKITIQNKIDGEMAVRDMSKKAQEQYNGCDYNVAKYLDSAATQAAEDKAFEEDRDFFEGELDVYKFAILLDNTVERSDMTFEEVESFFESMYVEEDED